MKPDDVEQFLAELNDPLPWEAVTGKKKRERWTDEDEAASWAAASSTLGG